MSKLFQQKKIQENESLLQAGGLVETKRSSGLLATGEVQRLERLDQERYACSGLLQTRLFLVFLVVKKFLFTGYGGGGVQEHTRRRPRPEVPQQCDGADCEGELGVAG